MKHFPGLLPIKDFLPDIANCPNDSVVMTSHMAGLAFCLSQTIDESKHERKKRLAHASAGFINSVVGAGQAYMGLCETLDYAKWNLPAGYVDCAEKYAYLFFTQMCNSFDTLAACMEYSFFWGRGYHEDDDESKLKMDKIGWNNQFFDGVNKKAKTHITQLKPNIAEIHAVRHRLVHRGLRPYLHFAPLNEECEIAGFWNGTLPRPAWFGLFSPKRLCLYPQEGSVEIGKNVGTGYFQLVDLPRIASWYFQEFLNWEKSTVQELHKEDSSFSGRWLLDANMSTKDGFMDVSSVQPESKYADYKDIVIRFSRLRTQPVTPTLAPL